MGLESKCIMMSVTREGYTINQVDENSIKVVKYFHSKQKKLEKKVTLEYSNDVIGIKELSHFQKVKKSAQYIGSKARGVLKLYSYLLDHNIVIFFSK